MKITKLNSIALLFFTLTNILFCACENTGGDEIRDIKGVLIAHEGNFGAGNGSISLYDPNEMTVTNNIVKEANNGSEIASLIQSIYVHDGIAYIMCNNSDKVEFISMNDYTYLDNPLTNLSQPRYMTIMGDRAYISCWGPWGENFTLPDSYVAVIDLNTRTVVDSLDCGSGPEGLVAVGNSLFVANSFETTVSVIDVQASAAVSVTLQSSPRHFLTDGSGMIWISTSVGLQEIDPVNLDLGLTEPIPNIQGKIALHPDGNTIYVMAVEPWDPNNPNQVNFASQVWAFDTESKILGSAALVTGSDFYGIGVHPTSGNIYVADSRAFSGPGEMMVYDDQGNLIDSHTVAVGPSQFIFN
jgi:DNA-binding beta-propeller fold protein YncE